MVTFDEDKFAEKYVHYFEELEQAYSNAYQELHEEVDSTLLKAIDRQVMNESEPVYEGDGQFRIDLPANPSERVGDVAAAEFEAILERYTDLVEQELAEIFDIE